jgi:hypothetical protein
MNKAEWLWSLKPGDKVRCFIRTGKGGEGEVMTIETIGGGMCTSSGIGVKLEEIPWTSVLDSYWIEELMEGDRHERQ